MKAIDKRTRTSILIALAVTWVAWAAIGPSRGLAQETQPPPAAEPPATEEPPAEETPVVEEEIIVTGTRFEGRAVTATPAPVDYIDTLTIERSGSTETGKILQLAVPSANFSTTFVSDGTDAIRPATLRGLSSDHVLVLINGKRRHTTAHLNYQQSVARGDSGVDINAIPAASIDHIEVLRDGAAAQYGADAIAGVINIILKNQTDGTDVILNAGETYESDGQVLHGSVNSGFEIGEDGYFNVTAEYRDREETNRAGPDSARVSPPRVTQRLGDPDATDAMLWMNLGIPVGAGEFYAFGGYSERETNSSGFFRTAGDGRTVPALYPNGFLPTIITKPKDASLVAGFHNEFGDGWNYDFSVNWGTSEFAFREENTVNVSYWYEPRNPSDPNSAIFAESPTAADTGTLKRDQLSFNLDFTTAVDWGIGSAPLMVGFGAEWRDENYQIEPGEPASYEYGRNNDFDLFIFNQTGGRAAPGTQGFPGFQTAVDESRDNIAAYVDFESHLTDKFFAGVALRYEDYSDFGSTLDYKLSARFDFTDKFALRGTASTGFRAPGVQQVFFTLRSINLDTSGNLADTLSAANPSPLTQALGVSELTEESSENYSVGLVWRTTNNFRLTVDAYRIDINDRVIYSDAISAGTPGVPPAFIAVLNQFGLGQVQFFTNAVDTQTEGLDIVAVYDIRLKNSLIGLEGAVSLNDTEVTQIRAASSILPANALLPPSQVTVIEEGQPQERYLLGVNWFSGPWSVRLSGNYYGSVAAEWYAGFKQTWGGKWLGDASITYDFSEDFGVSIGGLNIFDEYPDEWNPRGGSSCGEPNCNVFPLLGFTYGWETLPFGMNGGSYFARLNFHLDHGD